MYPGHKCTEKCSLKRVIYGQQYAFHTTKCSFMWYFHSSVNSANLSREIKLIMNMHVHMVETVNLITGALCGISIPSEVM